MDEGQITMKKTDLELEKTKTLISPKKTHSLRWMILFLFICVAVSAICQYKDWVFVELNCNEKEMIGDIVAVYCALFSLVLLCSFVFDRFFDSVNLYENHIKEYNKLVKDFNDKGEELRNANPFEMRGKESSLDVDQITIEITQKINELTKASNKITDCLESYDVPILELNYAKNDFKCLIYSMVFTIVVLLCMKFYSIPSLNWSWVFPIRSGFMAYSIFILPYYIAQTFKLISSGHIADNSIKQHSERK